MADPTARRRIEERLLAFCDAFNRDSLDEVMTHFTPDAVYVTFDGQRCQGPQAIRAAFEPQFRGAFGRIRFLNEDLIVDVEQQRAVLRWTCEHQAGWNLGALAEFLIRLVYGRRVGWQGLDVFYLEGERIREKHTFARTRLPLAQHREAEPWRGAADLQGAAGR